VPPQVRRDISRYPCGDHFPSSALLLLLPESIRLPPLQCHPWIRDTYPFTDTITLGLFEKQGRSFLLECCLDFVDIQRESIAIILWLRRQLVVFLLLTLHTTFPRFEQLSLFDFDLLLHCFDASSVVGHLLLGRLSCRAHVFHCNVMAIVFGNDFGSDTLGTELCRRSHGLSGC
jgi:hypothetical protein